MGKVRQSTIAGATLVAIIILAFGAYRAFATMSQGYSWKEMDWNQDGTTTLSEFLDSSDIAKRTVMHGTRNCIEYFRLKDGLPVRTDCAS